jgi:hypothetical protein
MYFDELSICMPRDFECINLCSVGPGMAGEI